MDLSVGLTARVELTVTDADTAQTLGSGEVPVLATPRALAIAEAATVLATKTSLPGELTTVGTRVELVHKLPTPLGRTVVAVARLATVDGRELSFDVALYDGSRVVASGVVERVVLDRHRFVEKALAPPPAQEPPAAADSAAAGQPAPAGGTAP